MIFKKNNPGCPCCNCPCSCYKFDGNANDSMGNNHLTGTGVYTTGKLDQAASFTNGSQSLEHDHHKCFVPKGGSSELGTGMCIWFWLYRDKPVDPGLTPKNLEYIVSKGIWADRVASFSDTAAFTDFPGCWTIFTDPGQLGGLNRDGAFAVAHDDSLIAHFESFQTWEDPSAWVFFFMWYEIFDPPPASGTPLGNGRMSIIRNSTLVADEGVIPHRDNDDLTSNRIRTTCNEKLYVGKFLGEAQEETVKIDNLGFCKNIGTKAEMVARAATLYDSGAGKACNESGL